MSDIWTFERGLWIVIIDCMLTYAMITTALILASEMLMKRFGYSYKDASMIMESQFLFTAISLPFLGRFVDKFGRIIQI